MLVKWRFFDGVILDLSEIVENILKSKYLRKDFSNKLILHVFSHNKFNANKSATKNQTLIIAKAYLYRIVSEMRAASFLLFFFLKVFIEIFVV